MKKIYVTILEEDTEYVQRLALAIGRREAGKLDVAWYTNLERYLADGAHRQGELLLLGGEFQEESILGRIREECHSPVVLLLSEDGVAEEMSGYPVIQKYSPVGAIIRQLYLYAAESFGQETYLPGEKNNIIGVYAPWNLELSMLFSEILLQVVSGEEPALYVSLQECLGRKEDMEHWEEENLSDFISFLRRRTAGSAARLKSICRKLGRGVCIPPVDNPANLSEMMGEDYERLFQVLQSQREYQTIVLEFGNVYAGMYADMKRCQIVYCPYQDELLQEARRKQLLYRLELCGEKDLQLHFVKLPRLVQYSGAGDGDAKTRIKELLCSGFGDAVRGLVDGYGS